MDIYKYPQIPVTLLHITSKVIGPQIKGNCVHTKCPGVKNSNVSIVEPGMKEQAIVGVPLKSSLNIRACHKEVQVWSLLMLTARVKTPSTKNQIPSCVAGATFKYNVMEVKKISKLIISFVCLTKSYSKTYFVYNLVGKRFPSFKWLSYSHLYKWALSFIIFIPYIVNYYTILLRNIEIINN